MTHDIQSAILTRTLLKYFLAGTDTLYAYAARQFFKLAGIDLLIEVEQMTDKAARGADDNAACDERTGFRIALEERANDLPGYEQQFGLAGRARRPFMSVLAQHGHFAKNIARLANAQTALLVSVGGKNAN